MSNSSLHDPSLIMVMQIISLLCWSFPIITNAHIKSVTQIIELDPKWINNCYQLTTCIPLLKPISPLWIKSNSPLALYAPVSKSGHSRLYQLVLFWWPSWFFCKVWSIKGSLSLRKVYAKGNVGRPTRHCSNLGGDSIGKKDPVDSSYGPGCE